MNNSSLSARAVRVILPLYQPTIALFLEKRTIAEMKTETNEGWLGVRF